MSYAKDDYSGIIPEIALHKSVTVNGGLIAKKMAIGEGNNRLVVKEDGVYIGCPCKFDDDGAPMEKEQLRYYSLHAVIEAIQELNRRTAWMENDLGVSESFASTDQVGDNTVDTYHSNTKDLLPGLRNLKEIGEELRTGMYNGVFITDGLEWEDGLWKYYIQNYGDDIWIFSVLPRDAAAITDNTYETPYGVIRSSVDHSTAIISDISSMFFGCENITSLNLSRWDTSTITTISYLFKGCKQLSKIDLSNWNVSKAREMDSMFEACESLISIDLSTWHEFSALTLTSMFKDCKELHTLNLANWDTSSVENMDNIFNGCDNLVRVTISNNGANMLEELPGTGWTFKHDGTYKSLQNAVDSSDWTTDFGSDTLTFTRTL